jgi:hypothetical protein
MNLYQDIPEAILAIQAIAAEYPNINAFIDRNDYARWQKRLGQSADFEAELTAGTFNIVRLFIAVDLERRYPELPRYGTAVIRNLEYWLGLFPQLVRDKKFPGKLKNLDRDSFLSTLSELLVAAHVQSLGLAVTFEHKFTVPSKNGQPDVDLTVSNSTGETLHLEVYSPYLPVEERGFLGLDDADEAFSKKVAFKMDDKFGPGAVSGLNGKVLLAVDTQKVDMFGIRRRLTGQTTENLYSDMANYLAFAVDGYLFFRGDITAPQSFIFEKLVLKKHA